MDKSPRFDCFELLTFTAPKMEVYVEQFFAGNGKINQIQTRPDPSYSQCLILVSV